MLPRIHRLPRDEISAARSDGKRIRTEYIDYYVRAGRSRFAVVVGSHVDKRAAVRNRMKRLVHEALRRRVSLPSVDAVLVVRKKFPERASYETVASLINSIV